MALNRNARTLATRRGVWTIEARHARPGGDVDVILGFTTVSQDRRLSKNLYGYRYDRTERRWTQIAGTWNSLQIGGLATAISEVATTTRTQILAAEHIVELLELALDVADFPQVDAPEPPAEWIPTREAAELLQASTDMVRAWVNSGLIEGAKNGSRYELLKSSVLAYAALRGGAH